MSTESIVDGDAGFTEPETTYEEVRHWVATQVNEHIVAVLLAPALLTILAIFIYPVVHLFWQSFQLTFPGVETRFAGLYNYRQMFTAPEFWTFFQHTLVYSFGSLAVSLTSGLVVALGINKITNSYLRSAYSTVIMFAWAIPLAVVALIWRQVLLGSEFGALNMVLLELGVVAEPVTFLANQTLAMMIVTLVDAWARMPFAMVVFLAGLQSVPQHMYDAAKIDGATTFQTFRNITLPYLRPYFAIVALINWMFAFRAFAVIFPMTSGGPGQRTTVFSIYIYRRGMINLNFGYAAAVAVFLVAITVVVAAFYVTVVLERIEE